MKFMHVFKGKFLVTVLAGLMLIGGATVVFASPAAHQFAQSVTTTSHRAATGTPGAPSHQDHGQGTPGADNTCPGLPEVQRLAGAFSLSTDSAGDAIQALCALHQGTFKGTTPGGTAITSSRVFGYGEIEMLLAAAQLLASHDKANAGGKLTSSTVRSYLAQALQGCGSTALETCLTTNIPGFHPGPHNIGGTATPTSDHGHGNGGKPTSTPTPPSHN